MVYIHTAFFICPSVNAKNRPGCLLVCYPQSIQSFCFYSVYSRG